MRRNHSFKNILIWVALTLLVIALIIILLFFVRFAQLVQSPTSSGSVHLLTGNTACVSSQEPYIVKGGSLSPLLTSGQSVELARSYYNCNSVKRGDIVFYHYAGSSDPLIKIVRAIPGDTWSIQEDDRFVLIIINGKTLTNSQNTPYRIPLSQSELLKRYAQTYPTIPEGTYLLLGNITSGSLDATRFGLVSIQDIIGKAIIK